MLKKKKISCDYYYYYYYDVPGIVSSAGKMTKHESCSKDTYCVVGEKEREVTGGHPHTPSSAQGFREGKVEARLSFYG